MIRKVKSERGVESREGRNKELWRNRRVSKHKRGDGGDSVLNTPFRIRYCQNRIGVGNIL